MSAGRDLAMFSEPEMTLSNGSGSSAGLDSCDIATPDGSGYSTPKFILPVCKIRRGSQSYITSSDENNDDEDNVFEDNSAFSSRHFKVSKKDSAAEANFPCPTSSSLSDNIDASDLSNPSLSTLHNRFSRSLDFSTVNIPSGKLLSPAFTPSRITQSVSSVSLTTSPLAGERQSYRNVRVRPVETKVMSAERLEKFKNERVMKFPQTYSPQGSPGRRRRGNLPPNVRDSVSNPCSPTSSPPIDDGRKRAWSSCRSPSRLRSSSWSPSRSSPLSTGSSEEMMCDVVEEE